MLFNKTKQFFLTSYIMFRYIFCYLGNANGRCHIFHQLISICRDMAETIVMLDKSLKTARVKFNEEDKETYMELFETDEFLLNAGI